MTQLPGSAAPVHQSWPHNPYGAPEQFLPQHRPLDIVSVVSLVTGLLGLVLVGLVTGVVGLVRTIGSRRRGRSLAVAGLVASVAWAALQVVVVVAVYPSFVEGFEEAFEAGTSQQATEGVPVSENMSPDDGTGSGGMVEAFDLEVGACFDDPEEDVFSEVLTVACDEPHDGQVFASIQLEGGPWPGETAVEDDAYDRCLTEAADAFLAAGLDGADYDYWTFTPTREGWVLFEDREVLCLLYGLDGPLTGKVLP